MLKKLYIHIKRTANDDFSDSIANGLKQSLGQLGFEFVRHIEQADAVITDSVDAVAHLSKMGMTVIQYVWSPTIEPYKNKPATHSVRIFRYISSRDSETFEDMASYLAGID